MVKTINGTVQDLSEEPVISDVGTMIAGIDKTVTCAPLRNCSTVIQWKKSDVSGIWKNSPTITFTPSLEDHQKTITCEMTNSIGRTTRKTILLDVCSLSGEPVISDVGALTAGIDKTVTCAPSGNCPATSFIFQWKKSDVSGVWKNSSTVTFTPSPDDHQKTITCEMIISEGKTTQKNILLDVYLPLLEDPKFITGLSTGGVIIFSAILLGIVFLMRRYKKDKPSEPSALTRDSPARMKVDRKVHGGESCA
ncbi:myeloid cell surface antigen CD33-like [Hyla sarda]|uniref:myeloid cell surface antigen CD33-like n=1 Tax=Hyla sarda TaxID=327740 RepID=UPI0024C2E843|nr:myeloid cell surface antigen CD33-like [Hyla sarda]